MAAPGHHNPSLAAFFYQMEMEGGVIVAESPKLDLDLYIQPYRGRTRFERLLHIGRTSQVLCVDALRAAVVEAKAGKDVGRYRSAWESLRVAAPDDKEAILDEEWVEVTEKKNKQRTSELENQLKAYKNNLVKESIRIANQDIGLHYEETGELILAAEAYGRMRPDASTSKHIIDVGRHQVDLSIQRREWSMVLSNLNKINGMQLDDEGNMPAYIRVVRGLGCLGTDRFEDAAKSFIDTKLGANSSAAEELNHIVTPNDIAVYGGLLALATMDRQQLQKDVLENTEFRVFLEMEPHIRRSISHFVNGRYSSCLAILESYRSDYLLDIYLQKHIPAIYSAIRNKCIVQYFIPYSCVTLESMNEAFARPGESLEKELSAMIKSGDLQARINMIDGLLTSVAPNPRSSMVQAALEAAANYEKEALERLRRLGIAAADLEVRGNKRSILNTMGDSWYEESAIATPGSTF